MSASPVTQANNAPLLARVRANSLNDLSASEWIAETVSVFVQRGLGKDHEATYYEKLHPAPFSFQDIGRLVRFFTKRGGTVLDPFAGVGSTLKACALNARLGTGVELQAKYCTLAKKRLAAEVEKSTLRQFPQRVIEADIREAMKRLHNDSFDLIVTSPPYWNILDKIDHKAKQERVANGRDTNYGRSLKDLARIPKYDDFVRELADIFGDLRRTLKPKRYLTIIVSDFRHKARYYMLHADLAREIETRGYTLKGTTVLYQKNKRVFPYGYPYSYVPNIHNQFILIFQSDRND